MTPMPKYDITVDGLDVGDFRTLAPLKPHHIRNVEMEFAHKNKINVAGVEIKRDYGIG